MQQDLLHALLGAAESGGYSPDGRVEAVEQLFVMAVEEMAVTVERGPGRGVPEPLLDLLRVPSLPDEDRRAAMPKVVEPQTLRQSGSLDGWVEVAVHEVVVTHGTALCRGEDVAVSGRGSGPCARQSSLPGTRED